MRYTVEVDADSCIASGECIRITMGAFRLDERDVAYLAKPEAVSDEELEQVEASCPTRSIMLRRRPREP
jgi:ferredoxin